MDEKIIEEISNIMSSEIRLLYFKSKRDCLTRGLAAARLQFPEKEIAARICDEYSLTRYYIIE